MIDTKLGKIDLKKESSKPKLKLCKPNREIIDNINNAYDIKFNQKLGALDELTFRIPNFVNRRHEIVKIDSSRIIKGKYLIKFVLENYEEYFIISSITKNGGDEEYLDIEAYSLGFELNSKLLREIEEDSMNAQEQLEFVLEKTNWNVGYVDSEFVMKYRSLEVSKGTVLETIVNIAKTFNALIVWDTKNRRVSFYMPSNIGQDKGFKIKYGKLLENVEENDNADNIITRLYLYGKEGMSVQSVNPTGAPYIEDYSVYLQPYEEELHPDGTYTVITKSDYMSDELAHAIIKYRDKVRDKEDEFNTLLGQKRTLQEVLNNEDSNLFQLESHLATLLDERDALNTRIAKKSDEIDSADNRYDETMKTILEDEMNDLVSQRNTILNEIQIQKGLINSQENEVIYYEQDVAEVDYEIELLRAELAIHNNFTNDEITEWNSFIHDEEWEDSNITDPDDLFDEGHKVFDQMQEQRITLTVSLFNLFSAITEQHNWDKVVLGDSFRIEYERLEMNYKAKITEIEHDFETDDISLTISNVEALKNDQDKFLEMLYKSYSSSSVVDVDSWKWDLSKENNGKINEIINGIWDANKQAIVGAKDQVVEISDRGLIIRDPNDPNVYLVGINGMIAITNDGGNTWKHAITSEGIVGEYIYGKVFMGVNLALEDEDGVLKFQGSKGEIFDREGNLVMKLGLIDENPDEFGLTAFNNVNKVTISDLEGFAVEQVTTDTLKYPDGWKKIFWTDPNAGILYSRDMIASNIKIVSNDEFDNIILDAETGEFNLGFFNKIVKDGKMTTDEKLLIIKEMNQISSQYQSLKAQAEKYQRSSRDKEINLDGAFDIYTKRFPETASNTDLYSIAPLRNAYLSLVSYISSFIKVTSLSPHEPILIDVADELTEQTTPVSDRAEFILKFKTYYDEAEKLRNKIEDAMSYSGINMGGYYNNLMMSDAGFVAVRNDGKYRAILNATNGLALQKWNGVYWENKIYGSIGNPDIPDGTLIAEDLVAKRLKIIDGDLGNNILLDAETGITVFGANGEEIRLNQEEGFAIDVGGEKRIWIAMDGTIRARKLIVEPEGGESDLVLDKETDAFISDLMVNSLKSIPKSADPTTYRNYVYIRSNFVKLMTGDTSVTDIEKLIMRLNGTSDTSFPEMIWGAGDQNGNDRGYIQKTGEKFMFKYVDSYAKEKHLTFNDSGLATFTGVELSSGGDVLRLRADANNYIEISSSGVKVVGSRIDLN
jgi:phage minor structural protein